MAELLAGADVATGAFFNVMSFDEQNLTQGFSTSFNDTSAQATEVAPRRFQWLDSLPPKKPVLAWMHYYIAHSPFEPPAALREQFATVKYAGPLDDPSGAGVAGCA
ncbi:MAG: hypothetical protein EXS13_11450 [Planctomycetes bacterium]|nr:hypothetical protein [Planctomycetota bacterium]